MISSISKSVTSFTRTLLVMLLFFGGINLVLWGTQELVHSGNKQKLEVFKNKLNTELQALQQMEARLETTSERLKNKKSELEKLDAEIKYITNTHSSGIPSNIYNRYSILVDAYNQSVPEYNQKLKIYRAETANYESAITAYNSLVNEYNSLANTTVRRVYIVPKGVRR